MNGFMFDVYILNVKYSNWNEELFVRYVWVNALFITPRVNKSYGGFTVFLCAETDVHIM